MEILAKALKKSTYLHRALSDHSLACRLADLAFLRFQPIGCGACRSGRLPLFGAALSLY